MKLTIPPQFNLVALANRVQPQEGELLAAKMHRGSVRSRLTRSFALSSAHPIGSHSRGTAIRWHSDLDLMVVLRKEEYLWAGRLVSSDTILARVLADLRERFPRTTIRRDMLAAVLDFGGSKQSLDVVPAMFKAFSHGRPVFLIPDGDGSWLETSPAIHERLYEREHVRSGNKLRKVSQMLKWWKHGRQQALPIRSFYIDMLLASKGICVGAKTYASCLRDFFELLVAYECAGVSDPCGIAGTIGSTNTQAQRDALNRAAVYALFHARAAIQAEGHRSFDEANRQWDLVFNGTY